MELVRGLGNLRERHRGGVVTLGTFDGLHLGHRSLVGEALALAGRLGRPALMLSFEPMPREFLQPQSPPARLTNFRERWRLLERAGLDALCLLRFGEALRAMPGAEFVALLHEAMRPEALVVGYDFRFGHQGEASAAMLREAGRERGFAVQVMPPVLVGAERVSSSGVRAALAKGDLGQAARLLGRPYAMRGRVVAGQRLGRQLGYPTANLRMGRRRVPIGGIFAVRVHGVGEAPLRGVASLGTRPTVGGVEPLLETHVFDFAGDLYGREIEVEFVQKIRDEAKFDGLDALVEQMDRDAHAARRILAA
ncbi:MAG: bifunctional riboflavin kinase/FAD synthetase [Steroidobacteraceae bacterium]|jgi:riboflavin kinase/FMN adenylyltransferase|nr:bifunctional riboflavin kinase/FAD synthetase [Steroidobacteraceae bacterium]